MRMRIIESFAQINASKSEDADRPIEVKISLANTTNRIDLRFLEGLSNSLHILKILRKNRGVHHNDQFDR